MRLLSTLIQCVIACAIGSVVFMALTPNPNPKVPLIGGLLIGFAGSWAITHGFLWLKRAIH